VEGPEERERKRRRRKKRRKDRLWEEFEDVMWYMIVTGEWPWGGARSGEG